LENQLRTKCAGGGEECEIQASGENFLTARVQQARFGENVQLFSFQSIDAAVKDFTRGFRQAFLLIGAGGVLLVLVFSAFGSRSISQPLTNLVVHLNESERTGRLQPDFSIHSPVNEVNRLGEAFNRAAEAIQQSQENLERATLEFIETMAQALDARDPDTAGHSNRVAVNSTSVAAAMGLSTQEVEIIRIAAKLHDIGKIGVPDAVLRKPGRLTDEEYAIIKLHPQIGKRILEKVGRFQEYLPIVELHHENFDGSGYPHGLRGDQVPLGVRIVHVADVYDAVNSNRAYRKAMTEEQVMEILNEGSGRMFDPVVLEAFFGLLRKRQVLQQVFEQAGVASVKS